MVMIKTRKNINVDLSLQSTLISLPRHCITPGESGLKKGLVIMMSCFLSACLLVTAEHFPGKEAGGMNQEVPCMPQGSTIKSKEPKQFTSREVCD